MFSIYFVELPLNVVDWQTVVWELVLAQPQKYPVRYLCEFIEQEKGHIGLEYG